MAYKIKYSRKEKKEQKKNKYLNQNIKDFHTTDNWIDAREEYVFI